LKNTRRYTIARTSLTALLVIRESSYVHRAQQE